MSKALPFDSSGGFTAIPNAVCRHYVKHPRFKPAAERLYRYLLMRYNADYGYAFPSWNAIIRETGISRGSIFTHMESLVYLGLINRIEHENSSDYNNTIYTFNAPIESEEEFSKRFKDDLKKKKKVKEVAEDDFDFEW